MKASTRRVMARGLLLGTIVGAWALREPLSIAWKIYRTTSIVRDMEQQKGFDDSSSSIPYSLSGIVHQSDAIVVGEIVAVAAITAVPVATLSVFATLGTPDGDLYASRRPTQEPESRFTIEIHDEYWFDEHRPEGDEVEFIASYNPVGYQTPTALPTEFASLYEFAADHVYRPIGGEEGLFFLTWSSTRSHYVMLHPQLGMRYDVSGGTIRKWTNPRVAVSLTDVPSEATAFASRLEALIRVHKETDVPSEATAFASRLEALIRVHKETDPTQ